MNHQKSDSRNKKSKPEKKPLAANIPSKNLKANKASPIAWTRYFWPGLILLITFISFYPVLKNNFTNWDDNAYVFENFNLSKSIPQGIAFFFGPHYFIGNYIPVTMLAYLLQFHAWGLNPEFYHMVNLLIHLLNVLLVYWFIYLLSGKKTLVAVIVSVFFGIHPTHVESVAWIAELKDVLYTFFFMGGLIAWYKYCTAVAKKNYKLPAVAFILFVVSVLCKPAAVAFPLVLILIDFYVNRPFVRSVWFEKIPFFLVSVIFGIITIKSQQQDRLLHDFYPYFQRLFFASHSLLNYIYKLFLPVSLSIFYPYPRMQGGHLPLFYYFTPVIVILLFYGVYRTLRHSKLVMFGFLFFLVNILLVLQLISVGDAVMADRYTYVPYIGLFFIIAMLFHKMFYDQASKIRQYKPFAIAGIIILAITCSFLTNSRCEVWRDAGTLSADLLNKFPDDRLVLNNEGFLLYEQGKYEESVGLFTKAIQMRPDYVRAYVNLVNSYLAMYDYENAMKVTDSALNHAPADYNVLSIKGMILNIQKKYTEALKYFKESLKYKPDNYDAYANMAKTYDALNDTVNSERSMDIALKYDAGDYKLINAKGYMLYGHGKKQEAMKCYNEAIRLRPDFITPYINLAQCYYDRHDYENALTTLDNGLKYTPDDYIALNNKGYLLFIMGKSDDALEYYKRSVQIKPDYITANINLANCYRALGDSVSANDYYAKVQELETKYNR